MHNNRITAIIADDEAPARSRLKTLLEDIGNVDVVGEAKNGKEALLLAEQHHAQLLLLDIRMPQMDGIEAAEHAQKLDSPPAIIFTTAYDAYALKAFDLNAVDYLLKPIRLERLNTAISKAHALLPKQLEAIKSLQHKRTHFSVNERNRILLVPLDEVIYLRAELKYITVKTAAREYLIEDSLTHLEEELAGDFIRIHRNCLVAKNYIAGLEKQHGETHEAQWLLLLKNQDEKLAVSRRQIQAIKDLKF
ncbi:MAG TPA: LytTR family DNA-binding domain-containing protein [Methylophilaceae bacterium]|jgi:two-component system response regulator AlgR